jgi:hypothetical protein
VHDEQRLPALSSNVTVVTCPLPPASSLVQTRREGGVTSRYLPWNAMGSGGRVAEHEAVRAAHANIELAGKQRQANDFGTHQRWNSSALVHASNTMRGGALMVRVTTSSRSDFRSTDVRFFMGLG